MRLILYYDNMNYISLRKYYSEALGRSSLPAIHPENRVRTEFLNIRIPVEDWPAYLRLYVQGRQSRFRWSYDGEKYEKIGCIFDTMRFSGEYCKYGEFTVTMAGITCAGRAKHAHYADLDFLEYAQEQGEWGDTDAPKYIYLLILSAFLQKPSKNLHCQFGTC